MLCNILPILNQICIIVSVEKRGMMFLRWKERILRLGKVILPGGPKLDGWCRTVSIYLYTAVRHQPFFRLGKLLTLNSPVLVVIIVVNIDNNYSKYFTYVCCYCWDHNSAVHVYGMKLWWWIHCIVKNRFFLLFKCYHVIKPAVKTSTLRCFVTCFKVLCFHVCLFLYFPGTCDRVGTFSMFSSHWPLMEACKKCNLRVFSLHFNVFEIYCLFVLGQSLDFV